MPSIRQFGWVSEEQKQIIAFHTKTFHLPNEILSLDWNSKRFLCMLPFAFSLKREEKQNTRWDEDSLVYLFAIT